MGPCVPLVPIRSEAVSTQRAQGWHVRVLGGIWAMLSSARHSHSPPWVAARPQDMPRGDAWGTPLHRGVRVGVPLPCLEAQAAALAPTAAQGEAGSWGGGQGGTLCP